MTGISGNLNEVDGQCRKAQAGIEFLFSIIAILFVLSVFLASFSVLQSDARTSTIIFEKTINAEHDARLAESYLTNSVSMDYPVNISGRIEDGRFKTDYTGKIIEIRGVFNNGNSFSEPS